MGGRGALGKEVARFSGKSVFQANVVRTLTSPGCAERSEGR